MNSYRNLKKLFREDLVTFNKVDRKYTIRLRNKSTLISEFFPVENYPVFMLKNKNPYVLKIYIYKENYLNYLNIDSEVVNRLSLFVDLNIYFNEFNKELVKLKVIDTRISEIVKYSYVNFEADYKSIENITFYISKIVNYAEININYDFIKVLYDLKTNILYIDELIVDIKEIESIISKYKKDFKLSISEHLDCKVKSLKDFINEY